MIRLLTVATFLLFASFSSQAQGEESAHLNLGLILEALPQSAKADSMLNLYQDSLETGFKSIENDFNTKLQALQVNGNDLTPNQVKEREQELQEIQQRVQVYQQESSRMFEQRRAQYLTPILTEIDAAIKDYAKKNGTKIIFDVSVPGALLFAEDTRNITQDIIDALK